MLNGCYSVQCVTSRGAVFDVKFICQNSEINYFGTRIALTFMMFLQHNTNFLRIMNNQGYIAFNPLYILGKTYVNAFVLEI